MKHYYTIQGDTWDTIAKKVYGAEKYAGHLMANNRSLLDCLIFPSGMIMEVPEPSEETDLELPAWRA